METKSTTSVSGCYHSPAAPETIRFIQKVIGPRDRNAAVIRTTVSRAHSTSTSLPATPAQPSATIHPIDHTPITTNSDGQRLRVRASQTSSSSYRFTSSVVDQIASNATREQIDPVLLDELSGAAFFPASKAMSQLFNWAVDTAVYDIASSRWKSWPSSLTEGNVLAFFQSVVDNVLLDKLCNITGARVYPYVPSTTVLIRGGDCRRKTDLLMSTRIPNGPTLPTADIDLNFATLPRTRYDWRCIRIVGELNTNPYESDCDSTLAQLAKYVREMFNAQPSRRWVHVFTLCGASLRAWLFDRSGATSSRLLDINAEPVLFLRIVCGYALMDASAVGFDPSIKWSRNGVEETYDPSLAAVRLSTTAHPYLYAPLGNDTGRSEPVKLEIHPNPLFNRRSIVTRGSVCWKARRISDEPSVATWSTAKSAKAWPYVVKDQRRAAERQSECDIISSMRRSNGQSVDIISTVRRGCIIEKPQMETGSMPDPPTRPTPRSSKQSSIMPPLTWTTSRGTKRRSTAEDVPESKRARHDDVSPCNNRIFSRLVMAPVGRAIDTFTMITELLEAMRDAIRGHRTLYNTHRILHRNVSLFNILIDDDPSRPGKGLLIDLDLAIRRERIGTTGASHRTGTQDFMAPGLLIDQPHSFRHDLESFFYVLLWIATYYTVPHGDGSVTETRLPPSHIQTIFAACDKAGRDYSLMGIVKSCFVLDNSAFDKGCLSILADDMREALGPLLSQWRDALYPSGYSMYRVTTSPDAEADLWQRLIDACQAQIDYLDGR
ncbi:hypothetical protein FN846DRAFT_907877 [Sphaerosporella brunnea]|uniref:Fungal-type protein kinase domain-containing protein n=1 Tax=Sphaerosporella brunnea TaxID=1250544 RepID=A0A5J5EUL4_9PEZI|nr:hypothetical protein FN846DRAFT_907877 [Sphaerosporella brunnea]